MSEPTLIERLQHFEDHSKEAGDGYGAEVLYRARERITQLKAENAALKTFASAERQTLGDGRDYSLAAYILRDMPITKKAELDDLCHEMSKGNASRGDWGGLKWHWLNALLAEQVT